MKHLRDKDFRKGCRWCGSKRIKNVKFKSRLLSERMATKCCNRKCGVLYVSDRDGSVLVDAKWDRKTGVYIDIG